MRASLCILLLSLCAPVARAQTSLTTAFTYQGELSTGTGLATGLHDMRFSLFDSTGVQIGATQCLNNVAVAAGRFTVALDFGAQFAGLDRFLEIAVRADTGLDCTNLTGFATLAPRQKLTAAPYGLYALNAANATQLNGQAAAFYLNASNLNTGTLPSFLLSGTYSGGLTFSNISNSFSGGGAGLTALSGSNIASGTVADARLSSNIMLLNTPQTITAAKFFNVAPIFNLSTGTAPFAVNSTTKVANLNADLLDDLDSTALGRLAAAQTWAGANTFSNASNAFTGSGAGLTALNAGNLASGTVPDARLSGAYTGALTLSNAANSFTGNGAGLTGLNAGNLAAGTVPSARITGTYSSPVNFSGPGNFFTGDGSGLTNLNASLISAGTLPSLALSGTYGGALNLTHFANTITGTLTGNGAGVTGLNAANIASGTVPDARLPTNIPRVNVVNAFLAVNTFSNHVGIDALNLNNGALTYGLTFGNLSGEGIGSKRTVTGNQFGLDFYTNNTNRLAITRTGNVGIGTTSPQANLDVNGTIKATNLPGVAYQQYHDLVNGILLNAGATTDFDTIIVNVPADGFLVISAFIQVTGTPVDMSFNLYDVTTSQYLVATRCTSDTGLNYRRQTPHLSWVLPVAAGMVTLKTNGTNSSPSDMAYFDHNLTAIYVPVQY